MGGSLGCPGAREDQAQPPEEGLMAPLPSQACASGGVWGLLHPKRKHQGP